MAERIDSKGDPINRSKRASASAPHTPDMHAHVDGNALSRTPETDDMLRRMLFWFAERDTGFLKLRHSLDSSDYHLTWTWTTGPDAGSYVYVKVPWWRYDSGLVILKEKVLEVDVGVRKATPDKRGAGRA